MVFDLRRVYYARCILMVFAFLFGGTPVVSPWLFSSDFQPILLRFSPYSLPILPRFSAYSELFGTMRCAEEVRVETATRTSVVSCRVAGLPVSVSDAKVEGGEIATSETAINTSRGGRHSPIATPI